MSEYLKTQKSKRLVALDVFRGATVALMIMVNNPGNWGHIYSPLRHAKWFGCTPTDLVFPFFLFIVGTAMWYAFKKFDHQLNKAAAQKIIKRTLIIFFLGLLLNLLRPVDSFGELFGKVRIMGVLQRIAICYGVASFMVLTMKPKKLVWASGILLVGYWLLMGLFGDFTLEGNLAAKVDTVLLGSNHIYHGFGVPFDPEGLFSTIPAIVTVILGYFAGAWVTNASAPKEAVKKLILKGVLFVLGGLLWGLFLPIGKPIWTSSYVIYTGGLAMLTLGIAILFIDVLDYKKWAKPFVEFGANPLFIFVLSNFVVKIMVYIIRWEGADGKTNNLRDWLYQNFFVPLSGGSKIDGSLLFALTLIMVYWYLVHILYKKKIFIKI
ncbi:MAG: acyltransferase family protein [Fidelibacterota bacterium]